MEPWSIKKVWNQFFGCSGSGFHLRSKILALFMCILIETKLFCFLNFFSLVHYLNTGSSPRIFGNGPMSAPFRNLGPRTDREFKPRTDFLIGAPVSFNYTFVCLLSRSSLSSLTMILASTSSQTFTWLSCMYSWEMLNLIFTCCIFSRSSLVLISVFMAGYSLLLYWRTSGASPKFINMSEKLEHDFWSE